MTDEELFLILSELYQKQYRKLSGNNKYKFIIDEKKEKLIQSFIVQAKKSVKALGEDFLVQYLNYAFGKYAGRKNPWGGFNRFPTSWIVSKTLLKNFLKESSGKKWYLNKRIRENRNSEQKETTKILLKSSLQIEKENKEKLKFINQINEFEEKEKAKFHNSIKGRIWCVDFTTLFNPKSSYCNDCKFSLECKDLLKDNFIEIYKKRNLE